jgi:spheroidene monooxygenase
MAPAAQNQLPQADGCLVAMGLGEAPILRQCTFSIWRNAQAMDAYARTGAHSQAIAATYRNGFFSESMFVRMRVLLFEGIWQGKAVDFVVGKQPLMAAV